MRLHAMKGGRRHRQIALRRVPVGHGPDVGVDAKNFLQHHHSTFGCARRLGHVGGDHNAVCGGQVNKSTHFLRSLLVDVQYTF